jgi:hypothetical protein
LLQHAPTKDLLLTYHNQLGKAEDLHGYPQGLPWLDSLNLHALEPTFVNFQDNFGWDQNKAVDNGGWRFAPYTDALINCTNESFHYSGSEIDGQRFRFPGAYITEKTWKPLLAARPFLNIGQADTYKQLADLGLKFEFGFSIDYDQDFGDLTRIRGIFESVDQILSKTTAELFEQSLDSVRHNAQMINSGEFGKACEQINQQSLAQIKEFLL